jgi:hypothetical protein
MAKVLQDAIQNAIQQSVSLLKVNIRSKTWWNDDISIKRKEMSSQKRA